MKRDREIRPRRRDPRCCPRCGYHVGYHGDDGECPLGVAVASVGVEDSDGYCKDLGEGITAFVKAGEVLSDEEGAALKNFIKAQAASPASVTAPQLTTRESNRK